ncbi:toxin glutamine deamidase domain-containing protein [Kitasatospora sp. NPDC096128]|uniref:toxin glutamine deamidase domain-containing protein n=1 Tax=Kitasatospora sp. NPDC096128 TaxID=3155547 RepID=UPI003324D1D2
MTRKLPEELVPLLARTGHPWPQADEDALRKAAAHWREFAAEAERITRRGGESVQRVAADNSGHAVDSFTAYWRTYCDGGKGRLPDAHTAVGLVATAFDSAAQDVDGCKAEIIATLRNLAAELEQAGEQAAKVQRTAAEVARSADRTGRTGVFGGLEKSVAGFADGVKNAAAAQVAAGVEAVAVETAALKIAGLLAELGRGMKDALATALKDPAAVALLRLGTAATSGVTTASYRTAGGFDPLAAGLPAALGEPGVLGRDGTGLVVLSGKDGKPLVGVPGLSVKLDEHGQPVLGADGKPVILRSDGRPVADAAGLLVTTGPDGKPVVGVADLAVRLDAHGQPVLTDQAGKELHGLPLADLTDPRDPRDPKDPKNGPEVPGVVPTVDRAAAPVVPSVLSAALPTADPAAVPAPAPAVDPAADAAPAAGPPYGGSHRAAAAAADWSPPARDDGSAVRAAAPAHQGGGAVAASWSDADYPLQAPSHNGGGGGGGSVPVTVRTDSVAAPPAPAAPPSTGGPGYSPAPDAPPVVRQVGVVGVVGAPGQFGTPAYSGGYPVAGPIGTVGPGPLAVGGGYPAHPAAPFGSGIGTGAPGGVVGGGVVGGGVVGGAPVVGAPVAAGPQPGAPRTPAGTPGSGAAPHQPAIHGPATAPPPPAPAEPPIVGTTPVFGRPEPHHPDGRRRDTAAALADPTLAWGAVPVATAHAMALQLALRARRGPLADGPEPRLRTIADSRPSGLPGGLGPVDPQHQAELERRVPRDEDGLPVRHPDPAAGGWAEAVNADGHREPGRANNSLEIALSAVDTYTGRPTCAAPRIPTEGDAGERGGRDRAERELGAPFRDLGDGGQAFTRLADELRRAGHGAQAVLLTLDAYGRPHAWNAVNHQDTVTYLDHQLARRGPTPLHPATQGLWAIALTPEGRPVDLAVAG